MTPNYRSALIVGVGEGLGASLARAFAKAGMKVGLSARTTGKLSGLAAELDAPTHACDASEPAAVAALFAAMDEALGGVPDVVVYNPSARVRGSLVELDPAEVQRALAVTAFGAFLVAQQAVKRMLPNRNGAVLLTGASAGVKGYARSAPFAMGKFALRGLAQSMARELQPQGIHVTHFVNRRRHPECEPSRAGGPPRFDARPGRDRPHLSRHPSAGPQRMVLGGRGAALDGDVLTAGPAPLGTGRNRR